MELIIDAFFLVDVVLNFFSATLDKLDLFVADPRKIACDYFKGWFALDLVAALPLSLIAEHMAGAQLTRLARLGKVFRLLRLVSLVRVARLMKSKRNKFRKLTKLRSSVPLERILLFILTFFILCHVCASLWFYLAKLE